MSKVEDNAWIIAIVAVTVIILCFILTCIGLYYYCKNYSETIVVEGDQKFEISAVHVSTHNLFTDQTEMTKV